MKTFDKSKYSTNKSVVADLNKIKNKFQGEFEKLLSKYGVVEDQSTYESRIYVLETENKKLKKEISDLKMQLEKALNKNLSVSITQPLPEPHERHSWTREEEYLCAEEYVKCYVIQRANINLSNFVKEIKNRCPDISDGSLKAKMQNIKWVCSNEGIIDTFPTGSLANASKRCVIAVKEVLKKYKLK